MILDETDRALLRLLQQDADQSAAALAKNLDMSQPAIWRRIKRLKEEGVIKGVALNLNREKLGLGVTVFLGIKLATKGRVSLEDFERAVKAIPEVEFRLISIVQTNTI
ncbi:MAG: Lrp/AsnC family transcriptional regulator [Rhodobacteraceae bacterium]|nr:Lrp/AsnC family transcriptional regulator [Paracoccaceae bacterium]